jgi:hypothetical protein
MAKPPPTFASLEGLLEHGQRDGFDIRPTLLRVLTDLYLQKPAHPGEDERYYTELALRLLGSTDVTARTAVADRLARYPAAPRAVILRLARDVIDVAGPVLRHSPCLTAADLAEVAAECGAAHAAIVANRLPAAMPSPRATAAEPAPEVAVDAEADADHRDGAQASELTELFFAVGSAERREILINLDYTTPAPFGIAGERGSEIVARLETAALAHNTEAFAREVESAFGIAGTLARRIVGDELGEPIVVITKALRAPRAVVERILLFINPRIGQSVHRVYELATRYDEISTQAALRLVAIWREGHPREEAPTRRDPSGRRPLIESLRLASSGGRRLSAPREARPTRPAVAIAKR